MILLRWDLYTITAIYRMVGVGSRNVCLGIADRWRDPKIISPRQLPVIISHFGLKIAALTGADTIFLTKMQKNGSISYLFSKLFLYFSTFFST